MIDVSQSTYVSWKCDWKYEFFRAYYYNICLNILQFWIKFKYSKNILLGNITLKKVKVGDYDVDK